MPLELASFPTQLNPANPTSGDLVADGFKQINLVKGVLKGTFSNISGQVTATQGHLNNPLLATDRPPVPIGLGVTQVQTIPYYDSNATASTIPITEFGKTILASPDLDDLKGKIGTSAFVKKAGDTMTGPLRLPVMEVAGTNFKMFLDGNGAPTIQFSPGNSIAFDPVNTAIYIALDSKIAFVFRADGTFESDGDTVAGSTSGD